MSLKSKPDIQCQTCNLNLQNLSSHPTSEEISSYIKSCAENIGLLKRLPHVTTFNWGGHSTGKEEYKFARAIGYYENLLCDTELITGSGGGIMHAVLQGALDADTQKGHPGKSYIGFTEANIIANERANRTVNYLITFPDIEKRMEAFIRASQFGRVFPGGPGTLEEIMMFLAVRLHPKNKNIYYPFHLLDVPGGNYMKQLDEYLITCFGEHIKKFYEVFQKDPRKYVEEDAAPIIKKLDPSQLWNDDIYFPQEIQTPFSVSFENVGNINLSLPVVPNEDDYYHLMNNLRKFFSFIVHITIKEKDLIDEWHSVYPIIRGNKKILDATTDLIDAFVKDKRIVVIRNGREVKYKHHFQVAYND